MDYTRFTVLSGAQKKEEEKKATDKKKISVFYN